MNEALVGLLFLLALGQVTPVHAQSWFSCTDTQLYSSSEPTFSRSKYHHFQTFGEAALRSTNFFEEEYDGLIAWTESRLLLPHLSEWIDSAIPLPDPLFTGSVKGLKEIDWEDRLDYGLGIEWRPLKQAHVQTGMRWLYHIRLYALYLRTMYLQYRDEWSWRPKRDFRIGIELYRECNLYSGSSEAENFLWGEFWGDASWRETSFFIPDFRTWTFAFVPKIGIRLFPERELAIMPYATGEVSVTGRTDFWQNRLLAGAGVRLMPFRRLTGTMSYFLKGVRVYAEGLWVVSYFKDKAPPSIPGYDFRAGIGFTINRW